MLPRDSNGYLLKVDINGVIQDALAVCLVHHDECVHLQIEHLIMIRSELSQLWR